jgi:chemotaxis protein MotB
LQQQGLDPRLEPHGLVISLPQAILFSSGGDQISPAALPIVAQIADVLREIPNKVSLVGHADAVPIHNRRFKNNWELSLARGLKLLELLKKRYGIPESRLSIAGYSSYRPRNPNDTANGRAGNRRVEIVILDEFSR